MRQNLSRISRCYTDSRITAAVRIWETGSNRWQKLSPEPATTEKIRRKAQYIATFIALIRTGVFFRKIHK